MLKKIFFILSLIIIKNIKADLTSIKFDYLKIEIKNKISFIEILDIQNLLLSKRLTDNDKINLLNDYAKYLENFIYKKIKQSIPSKIELQIVRYKNQQENTLIPSNLYLNKNQDNTIQEISDPIPLENKSITVVLFKINTLLKWIKSQATYIESLD